METAKTASVEAEKLSMHNMDYVNSKKIMYRLKATIKNRPIKNFAWQRDCVSDFTWSLLVENPFHFCEFIG